MTRTDYLAGLAARLPNRRDRSLLEQSYQQHIRNGRGFWPVVTLDGAPQVVRFASADVADRWTPETGRIDLVPLHAVPVVDWARVRLA